jgi:hypothetical protein
MAGSTSGAMYPGALADVTGDDKADAFSTAALSNDLFWSTVPFLNTDTIQPGG